VQENMAKGSPGPIYKYEDQVKFREVGGIGDVTLFADA
jgi:hypothetical protein